MIKMNLYEEIMKTLENSINECCKDSDCIMENQEVYGVKGQRSLLTNSKNIYWVLMCALGIWYAWLNKTDCPQKNKTESCPNGNTI